MIGQRIKYSLHSQELSEGKVIDKIDMLQDSKDTSSPIISGYLVQDEQTNEVRAIQYWRVRKAVERKKGNFNY